MTPVSMDNKMRQAYGGERRLPKVGSENGGDCLQPRSGVRMWSAMSDSVDLGCDATLAIYREGAGKMNV
jgi:hypothetical protein